MMHTFALRCGYGWQIRTASRAWLTFLTQLQDNLLYHSKPIPGIPIIHML